jgi:hypothetical protein
LDDPPNVDCSDSVLTQYKRKKRKMPGVLSSIFTPRCICDFAAAYNRFEAISLNLKE